MKIRIRAALLALLMVSFIPVTSAHAITAAELTQQDINTAIAEQQAIVRKQLDEAMLNICRQFADNINTIKTFMGNMSDAQIKYIRSWHNSALQYKETNKIEFTDFARLASTAEQKYDAALTALAAYLAVPSFSCTSDGPKADFSQLMVMYMKLIMAIFEYIISVMNLYFGIIVAQMYAYISKMQSDMQTSMSQIQTDARLNLNQVTGGKQ